MRSADHKFWQIRQQVNNDTRGITAKGPQHMSEEIKRSKAETLKGESRQLRGTIVDELQNGDATFTGEAAGLLKHHGSYMQDDRDLRKAKNPDGTPVGRQYSCMVRTRIPGGRVTAEQFLAELDLCDRLANGTVRITSRQGFQLHGVLKKNLRETIRAINDTKLTTYAACGDVNRNVMCCPAPFRNNRVYDEMQELSQRLAEHFRPKSTAYFDIWLRDDEGNETNVADFQPVDEPIYGEYYLPRKFKMAIALPEDNCVDVYTQDIGLLAIVQDNAIAGYNVIVGGGMGRTPSAEKTYPKLGERLACVPADQVVAVCEAICKVQRDFGNREDRKIARMKYLVANWGIEKFRGKVEEYYGQPLAEPHPADVTGVDDHLGWHEQGDGKLFLGINIENGRIKDDGQLQIKSGLRAILSKYRMDTRLTALQSVILCDIDPADRDDIDRLMTDHGMKGVEQLSLLRRYAMACPAFPTCGLSITESERVLPGIIDELEVEIARHGLQSDKIALHMTGCPNGCARPYTPDIGLVGRAAGKYTMFLGGNAEGTRLAFIYRDMVPMGEIVSTLSPLFAAYKSGRSDGESFGDFCARAGLEGLNAA
jgi:sulfite reductase (ferredoxin)